MALHHCGVWCAAGLEFHLEAVELGLSLTASGCCHGPLWSVTETPHYKSHPPTALGKSHLCTARGDGLCSAECVRPANKVVPTHTTSIRHWALSRTQDKTVFAFDSPYVADHQSPLRKPPCPQGVFRFFKIGSYCHAIEEPSSSVFPVSPPLIATCVAPLTSHQCPPPQPTDR